MKSSLKQIIFYSALISVWALLAKLRILAPYLFPRRGSGTRIVGRLCRPQLSGWHRRHHEAHAHRLQPVDRARDDLGLAVSSNKFWKKLSAVCW